MNIAYFILSLVLVSTPPDGTVIFVRNNGKKDIVSKEIVKATGDALVHTAIILYDNNVPYVYESTVPGGVQKQTLEQFYVKRDKLSKRSPSKQLTLELVIPKIEYSQQEITKMKKYANSQLGRPYMARGWWKEQEVLGIHCSQYIGNIVSQSGRIVSNNYKESPTSLYKKLLNK